MAFFNPGMGTGMRGGPSHGGLDVYSKQFAAYPGAFSEQGSRVDSGGRVLLPAACLADMSLMNLAYPLQFEIKNFAGDRCFAGVLEFLADQGTIILPRWIFDHLHLQPGTAVRVQTVALPPGKLIKLRPQQRKFIELADPKLVLEQHLINYPVITKGTSIVINYIGYDFIIDVTDVIGLNDASIPAISTVRADAQATELKVEFERPLDMPPSPPPEAASPVQGSNVIGGGTIDFKPIEFKPPTLKNPSLQPKVESTSTPTPTPAPSVFSSGGRTLSGRPPPPVAYANAQPQTTAPSTATETATDDGQRLGGAAPKASNPKNAESINEKRLKAFGGPGRSLR